MSAPQKKDEEDPRIQLINMGFNGPTSCSGIVISILFLLTVGVLSVMGGVILLGTLGIPPILAFLFPPILLFFFWRSKS